MPGVPRGENKTSLLAKIVDLYVESNQAKIEVRLSTATSTSWNDTSLAVQLETMFDLPLSATFLLLGFPLFWIVYTIVLYRTGVARRRTEGGTAT